MKKLSILLAAFLSIGVAHSTVLLTENFNGLNLGALNDQNGWAAKSGVNVVNGGLNYGTNTIGNIYIDGGTQRVQNNLISGSTSDFLANKSFASQSGDVWFSLTLQIDSSTNNSRYWFWVGNNTNLNSGLHGSIADNNTTGKNFYSEIRNNTSGVSSGPTPSNEGLVYFLVGRLSKDGTATDPDAYDRFELWVNPTTAVLSNPLVANGPANSAITDGINSFGLTALGDTANLGWDNLRIGTTQADVLDYYVVPIPEPNSLALLFGGVALAFLGRRCWRR